MPQPSRLPLLSLLFPLAAAAAPPALPAGYPLHALTHARVYVTPEQVVDDATLVVAQGKVLSVQAGGGVPPGARVWDCRGKVIHAGYVEPFLGEQEAEGKDSDDGPSPSGLGDTVDDDFRSAGSGRSVGSGAKTPPFKAERSLPEKLPLNVERRRKLLEQAVLTVQLVPQQGVLRGKGSVYTLRSDGELLKPDSSQVVGLRTPSGASTEQDYPVSVMGNLALIRQAFREAQWALSKPAGLPREEQAQPGWRALQEARAQNLPVFFEGRSLAEGVSLRRTMEEQQLRDLIWVTTSDVGLRPDWLRGKLVLTVDFPKLAPAAARRPEVTYDEAARWRIAPAVAGRLARQNVPFVLSLHRLENWADYRERLMLLHANGLATGPLLDSLTRRPAQWLGVADRVGTLEPGKWAHFVVRRGEPFGLQGAVEQVWLEGEPERLKVSDAEVAPALAREGPEPDPERGWNGPGSVLIRGATVWTQSSAGVLSSADVLIVDGKVRQVGASLAPPAGIPVVDGRGRHLLPGLIDAHSHTAVVGDVNEGTLTVSAQVRIQDVLNSRDRNILHQLAGGVTCAHVLHGSANAIGGQTVTCKWRWGADPEKLILEGAPPGIKFALGENPKQANWGDAYDKRYPQTRLGVAALIRQRLLEAKRYRELQKQGLNPRPDAALDALVEILEGRRLVHSHCYRQDEILMLLRVAEEMGFRIATLQHGLEAYKVADEIARHGAGVSTFTDWWAYKLEVVDAIPYNGTLLEQKGVLTSFNSDSDELARRLLHEAAKAVKYGGLSEVAALNLITRNPAQQLGIQSRMGSLEAGKDGDCSLWSASPFDPQARCLATWVEGGQVYEEQAYRQTMTRRRQLRLEWLNQADPPQ
jgi:imidazolonepropionase-like amidohydrolase